ncbi:hypothetical protein T4D_14603 [Trichinella pseudospiralis]|uniref:Uncharacterized protein n=1 Tax=Trichinella pseudospiralis TaxID=6337 RepID=A0A0V1FRG9_TRIPS|nr:hypothetical protein T4D_14603 [Trichinella pseudospiralis]
MLIQGTAIFKHIICRTVKAISESLPAFRLSQSFLSDCSGRTFFITETLASIALGIFAPDQINSIVALISLIYG